MTSAPRLAVTDRYGLPGEAPVLSKNPAEAAVIAGPVCVTLALVIVTGEGLEFPSEKSQYAVCGSEDIAVDRHRLRS